MVVLGEVGMLKDWISFAVHRTYHNDPKFLDRQVWANCVDTDQTGLEREF